MDTEEFILDLTQVEHGQWFTRSEIGILTMKIVISSVKIKLSVSRRWASKGVPFNPKTGHPDCNPNLLSQTPLSKDFRFQDHRQSSYRGPSSFMAGDG